MGICQDLLPYLLGRLPAGLGLLKPCFHGGPKRFTFLFPVLFFITL
jgi:hypothetical protein